MKHTADKDYNNSTDRTPAGNSGLAKVAVQCFVGQFCGYINFSASYEVCAENRHLRQALQRQAVKKQPSVILFIVKCS